MKINELKGAKFLSKAEQKSIAGGGPAGTEDPLWCFKVCRGQGGSVAHCKEWCMF